MNHDDNLRKLPLWKSCLEKMRSQSLINYGEVIDAPFFEEHLECKRDSMEFGLAVSSIRRELEEDGFYLSGRGQKRNQFVILPPASNANVMNAYSRAAVDALKRGVILGTNTRLDTLTESEKRRHEGILERLATRAALVARSEQVFDFIRKNKIKAFAMMHCQFYNGPLDGWEHNVRPPASARSGGSR